MKPPILEAPQTDRPQNLVFIGLTLSSSWRNGHAATYRGLLHALHSCGHRIHFLEQDAPCYASRRDLPDPAFCHLSIYRGLEDLQQNHVGTIAEADAVIVGSFVPEAIRLLPWLRERVGGVLAFYDIDTPVTLEALAAGNCEYLDRAFIPQLDLYLSFSGGRALEILEETHGAARARHLPCAVDHEHYRPSSLPERYLLGYLGTYSGDRQPGLEEFLFQSARALPEERFAVAGPHYPDTVDWPANVDQIDHLPPRDHPAFYGRQRFTLNLTRAAMKRLGHSPSVRLFEAAACGSVILSDAWEGIEDYFTPGKEILLCRDATEVLSHLGKTTENARRSIGQAARARIMREHTPLHRALALERMLAEVLFPLAEPDETPLGRILHSPAAPLATRSLGA